MKKTILFFYFLSSKNSKKNRANILLIIKLENENYI